MTQNEIVEYKQKVRSLLKEYIFNKFGNQYENRQIMEILPELWKLLEDNNLVLPGLNYNTFVHYAHSQYLFAEFNGKMGF